ncbi:MAG: NADPH:quinone oxidoreductase family protein, partial [Deinococcus sp.]
EFAGPVTALGEGVQGLSVGQQVASLAGSGGLAEVAAVSARTVVPVPEGLNSAEAAAFPVSYYTAYITLLTLGRAQQGETVLVQGAAGALGTALIQVGRALGLKVVALASSEEKLAKARELGADVTLLSERDDIVEAVREASGGRGVNLLAEISGGAMFGRSLQMMANRGRVMVVGSASGESAALDALTLMKKNLTVTGVWLSSMLTEPGVVQEALAFLTPLVASGQLRPQIGPRYPLAESAQAFGDLQGRRTTGKVIIEPQR